MTPSRTFFASNILKCRIFECYQYQYFANHIGSTAISTLFLKEILCYYRAFQIRCARKVYGKNSLINKAYFLVYFNFSTRTKIYINDFLLYHELFINKVGSSWQLQQAPNHEKVAFLQGSPLNSPFLVEFLEPF